jgi:hypothetical protein
MQTRFSFSIAAIILFLGSQSFASQLLVSNTNDSGLGSLRQAINDNNTTGSNTIIFSNIVTGTITLTNGELLISKSVTILGPGVNVLAVNGHAAGRVFDISSSINVNIAGLTITNGNFAGGSGGGINNYRSTLTVSNCTLSGNTAQNGGAIYNNNSGGSGSLSIVG